MLSRNNCKQECDRVVAMAQGISSGSIHDLPPLGMPIEDKMVEPHIVPTWFL